MRRAFEAADTKLGRAEEHLKVLDQEIGDYCKRAPYKLVLNVQPQDRRIVLVEFHVIEEPASRLGAIIGDCVHNLRSSLDSAIYDLVAGHSGDYTRTQFPILSARPVGRAGHPRRLTVGADIHPDAIAFIETLQPYMRDGDADSDLLAIVRDLSNIDKHRTIHTVTARLVDTECVLVFPDGRSFGGKVEGLIAHHESAIAAFQFQEPFDTAAHGQVEMRAGGHAFVAVKHPGASNRPVVGVLYDILNHVRQTVLPGLMPFRSP